MKTKAVFLCFFLLAPLAAAAQLGGGDELVVSLTPERPGAFTSVAVEAESYVADLSRSSVRWILNGEVALEGVGEKRFTFRTGALGSVARLGITAETRDGRVFNKDLIIRPAEVTLLWQAYSYTPPFYKGKALFPFQGTVAVAAIPFFVTESGEKMDARELVYTWEEDGKVVGSASGYGNSLFAFVGGVPMREKTVSVEVGSEDNTLLASAEIVIQPVAPRLLLFENHPRYGILFNKALTNSFALQGDEVRLSAVPFFFEAARRADAALEYLWQANFSPLQGEKAPDIALRRVSGRAGDATVSLEARRAERSFQGDHTQLTVSFAEPTAFRAPETAQ